MNSRLVGLAIRPVFLTFAISAIFTFLGCFSTTVIGDYSPRLSSRTEAVRNSLAEKENGPTFYILNFVDERKNFLSGKTTAADLIWTDGMHSYKLQDQTVAAYLHQALAFDLSRAGFSIVSAKPGEASSLILSKKLVDLTMPKNATYALGVWVDRFQPNYKNGFFGVTPRYDFKYRVVLWNARTKKVDLDEVLTKNIEGTPTAMITHADLVDRLMNDYLPKMNVSVAELLVPFN